MYPYFSIAPELQKLSDRAEAKAAPCFREIEAVQRYNQQKMLAAFNRAGVSESHFAGSTGYGYGDRGRDVLDQVYAYAFGAEDALVRWNFVSGTHTLTVALFGVLRPGDRILCVTGTPYDTIQGVIGMDGREEPGSLREFGIAYEELALRPDGTPDYEAMEKIISPAYRMIYIQRSRGYSLRPSFSVAEIEKMARIAKKKAPDCIVMVDNCYGEFVERDEPVSHGADLMAGSLIKNPGGGAAPTGGYIAGRKDLVELCSYRLTTPGTGREIGCTLGNNRQLFMGAFHAPHVAGEALKTAVFASALFSELGFGVTPEPQEARHDIIQVILLEKKENLIAFCRGIQKGAPVDSFAAPEPSPMPGYDSEVIMAAGAFTLGSSIELSADAPLREPYAVWMQGGLNYHSGQLGVLLAAQEMLNAGLIRIPDQGEEREDGLHCEIFPFGSLKTYKYVVVCSFYKGKLLLSRHKNRATWETQGGHIEPGETPLEAARRELFEEGGVSEARLIPVCDYDGYNVRGHSNGMVFAAEIAALGDLQPYEMRETDLFEALPETLTYPYVTPRLFREAAKALRNTEESV